MKESLPHLHELLRYLQQVPYLASKNIYRVAEHFIRMQPEKREAFVQALTKACVNTVICETCCAWKEAQRSCSWCTAPRRMQRVVCVVETWHDLCAIERAGGYEGVFHVLGGVICPLEGIGPEQLSIEALVKRVAQQSVDEVIFALNQTIEGEITATCISKKLAPYKAAVKLTTLSRGVPVGSLLEHTDRITVNKALAERRPL